MKKTYKYLGYILLVLIPLTLLGFLRTYFVQFPDFEDNIDAFIHLHALIATIWIGMLIAQPLLILKKKRPAHRVIGKLSYFIFPLLILSFIPQMIRIIHSDNPEVLFFPLADCILLIAFYSLAIYNRKRMVQHMRYMIAISLVFLGPTVGRIGPNLLDWSDIFTQSAMYVLIFLLLIGLVIYDKFHRKNFTPYLVVLSLYVVHAILYYLILG